MVLSVALFAGQPSAAADRVSIVSAYLCTLLFCVVLLIGPITVITGGRLTLNQLLRRDLGIWTAVTGILHLALGTELSMNVAYLETFVEGVVSPPAPAIRQALFTWGTIGGFIVGLLFLLLLALSNNAAIRLLGASWWKRLQRSSYLAFVLTAIHGFAFQILESRSLIWIGVLAAIVTAVVAGQVAGVRALKRTR